MVHPKMVTTKSTIGNGLYLSEMQKVIEIDDGHFSRVNPSYDILYEL